MGLSVFSANHLTSIRLRSGAVTSTRSVSTHLHRPNYSLVQVATGCLLAQITPSLDSVGEEELSLLTEGRGVATVTCRPWEHRQALDLILLVQG
jgi:hypothetical protein